MEKITNLLDKIYVDSNTFTIVAIICSILLFIFIIMLIFSLRQPKDKKTKILDEPNTTEKDNDISKEEPVNESASTLIEENESIPEASEPVKTEESIKLEPIKEETQQSLSSILDKVEDTTKIVEEDKVEKVISNISSDIPNIDEFVDNVVKKTYEKNEQFSSVYVDTNTSTMNLDKVLDKMNVDDDIKEEIVPDEEKTIKEEQIKEESIKEDIKQEPLLDAKEEIVNKTSLDSLKQALDDKKKEVNNKQEELKNKLDSLKIKKEEPKENLKAEDLLNKLNSLKDTK